MSSKGPQPAPKGPKPPASPAAPPLQGHDMLTVTNSAQPDLPQRINLPLTWIFPGYEIDPKSVKAAVLSNGSLDITFRVRPKGKRKREAK